MVFAQWWNFLKIAILSAEFSSVQLFVTFYFCDNSSSRSWFEIQYEKWSNAFCCRKGHNTTSTFASDAKWCPSWSSSLTLPCLLKCCQNAALFCKSPETCGFRNSPATSFCKYSYENLLRIKMRFYTIAVIWRQCADKISQHDLRNFSRRAMSPGVSHIVQLIFCLDNKFRYSAHLETSHFVVSPV